MGSASAIREKLLDLRGLFRQWAFARRDRRTPVNDVKEK